MICQITNVPKRSSETLENSFERFGEGIATNINKEKSLSPVMNEMVKSLVK